MKFQYACYFIAQPTEETQPAPSDAAEVAAPIQPTEDGTEQKQEAKKRL